MDASAEKPLAPTDGKVPLQDYKPIPTGTRKAGDKDAVLGCAGPGDDPWTWAVVVLLAFVLVLVAAIFGNRR